MLASEVKIGMAVIFGRPAGKQTRGIVRKINFKSCKVELTEDRGAKGRPGHFCDVGWAYLSPDTSAPRKVTYNPFDSREDQFIMESILCCYVSLSPENLACDGERPMMEARRIGRLLERKLSNLQQALGRTVSELDAYDYSDAKKKWQKERQKA